MQRRILLLGSIIIVIMVAGVAEFMAYVMSLQLVKYCIGFTPLDITESYESYMSKHHPRLGWISSSARVDAAGSRPIPAFPDPIKTRACVSLYGDSFTEGAGVDHEHAWSNLLSVRLNCRVANFGVSGYGTDQAYLRFLDNPTDQAKVVILGFLSENIVRNVNQLRNLISTSTACFLKPRFILDDHGQLTLVPKPLLTKEAYNHLRKKPELVLDHEFFLPGGPSGYRKMEFPYTWGIFRVLPLLFKNVVLRQGTYYDLYRPDHPSRAVDLTCAVMEDFRREARRRGKRPLILVIPTHIDLAYYRSQGKWIYQPVTDRLAEKGLEFIDAGPGFISCLGKADLETLYSPKTMYHLNENGNAVLAEIVYERLKRGE